MDIIAVVAHVQADDPARVAFTTIKVAADTQAQAAWQVLEQSERSGLQVLGITALCRESMC
jgi:hypothetical protein